MILTEDRRIWLPSYLAVLRVGNSLRLGVLPPLAYEIEEAPAFLPSVLSLLAIPRPIREVVEAICDASDWTEVEAQRLVEDLLDTGTIIPATDCGGRYGRHLLYYRMLGVVGNAQVSLEHATVGLIGMGGIGSQLAVHLTAAGVGRLVITDGDVVEESNLTRQTLYRERDYGRLKVHVAAERLRELRSDVVVEPIPEQFLQPELAEKVAGESDIILLSADRPSDVHRWTNSACVAVGIPFSSAGYIEGHGIVGPFLIPKVTPCYECLRTEAESLPDASLDPDSVAKSAVELNPGFQAPSFGPLNSIVASIQANEAIRWLLKLPISTQGRRLLVDSRSYAVTWEEFSPGSCCGDCGFALPERTLWQEVAHQYAEERDNHSFSAILLDEIILDLLPRLSDTLVADVGAGAGQITVRLVGQGAQVDAYEPEPAMIELLENRIVQCGNRVTVIPRGVDALSEACAKYDSIVCLNVLDHVEDLESAIAALAKALKPQGSLVVSIPHPLKDRGGWIKQGMPDRWQYQHYVVDDYFSEGLCFKSREDQHGNIRIKKMPSFHRTISTYCTALLRQGLHIRQILEPSPSTQDRDRVPVIYDKASRIPYFLVIALERGS